MFANLTGWHALIILAVVLLIFGAAKLPALAKSVGQSMRILKKEVSDAGSENDQTPDARPTVTVSPSAARPAETAAPPAADTAVVGVDPESAQPAPEQVRAA